MTELGHGKKKEKSRVIRNHDFNGLRYGVCYDVVIRQQWKAGVTVVDDL